MEAYISNIQKFCVDDGPGIRTVVFFMGCPLRCKWCQNPENFTHIPKLMYDASKCVSCGACIPACPQGANIIRDNYVFFDRKKCNNCGKCMDVCYYNSREIAGKRMTVNEVFTEVMKDKVFFDNTNGGITLSGGECTTCPEYISELLQKFKKEGIHTSIETSGFCTRETIEKITESVDLFLYDIKAFTPEIHLKWTGVSNECIKDNLEYLVNQGKRIIIRIPLIPNVNTGNELEKIAQYLTKLKDLKEIHLLPFHQLGSSKYSLAGIDYELEEMKECSMDIADDAKNLLEKYGFRVNIGGWDS